MGRGVELATETIFLAEPNADVQAVYPEYKSWYEAARPILEQYCKVVSLILPDIWVRDFLPLQNRKSGKLYQPLYYPSFRPRTLDSDYAKCREAARKYFPDAEPMPMIRLDGGNLIVNDNGLAFAIFNKAMYQPEQGREIESALKAALDISEFQWLPELPRSSDPFGHVDGFGNFLGNDTIVTSISQSASEREAALHHESVTRVQAHGIKCEIIKTETDVLYGNFLETEKAVFVPTYNIPDDETAMQVFKANTDKPVIGIDCEAIACHGGSLHCLTKELKRNEQ